MLSRTGYIFLISGVLFNTILKWWLGYEWLEILGYGLILACLIVSKGQIIEGHSRYGIHIYYTLMILLMINIFFVWFAS